MTPVRCPVGRCTGVIGASSGPECVHCRGRARLRMTDSCARAASVATGRCPARLIRARPAARCATDPVNACTESRFPKVRSNGRGRQCSNGGRGIQNEAGGRRRGGAAAGHRAAFGRAGHRPFGPGLRGACGAAGLRRFAPGRTPGRCLARVQRRHSRRGAQAARERGRCPAAAQRRRCPAAEGRGAQRSGAQRALRARGA